MLQRPIVNDGTVRMVDTYDNEKFSKIQIKREVKAVRQGRFVSNIRRPAVVIGEKEQTVLDEIKIESLSGASLTIKKMRELKTHQMLKFLCQLPTISSKKHTELKTSKPKIVDANRLAVSCQQVLKSWYDMLNGFH
ncbi:uncharacterized protein MONOS_9755 [Monocercomonoides exilis]|uniref:uncharacterized protein n=1 Tax=Monocercomonoides exilis TaxID=2049356 RepID=UPI00355A55CF|nr:hypothetical protein MONOS_9755 [Monocercomonoides exilis]|eukprot:MONOS_9755.1-p1 / transcript=MONOS_9755.1 / gene=MONOS_9755 / organism=Monocercomonoides_exilis_PA203 / gene_product=unspecified product / transcript_product=unspecified product / location=Mono_scaffold00415:34913-35396(+) / protein_length=136 / sequence_SO=supercontig / SO=protein_coding / is_pseudo=false